MSFWPGSGVQALSVGERPYPLQDALISFAQAEPESLPDAQRTVPTRHGDEPVLSQHGNLWKTNTWARVEGQLSYAARTGNLCLQYVGTLY